MLIQIIQEALFLDSKSSGLFAKMLTLLGTTERMDIGLYNARKTEGIGYPGEPTVWELLSMCV